MVDFSWQWIYKENGNSICHETTWYTDGHVVSKTTTIYPDGHREIKTKNLVERCGIAVDPNISDEEFAKLKEEMRGIIADEVLDSEEWNYHQTLFDRNVTPKGIHL